jgi:hypothetical protein
MSPVAQAAVVGAIAGLVGLAELVGRYRSDPTYPFTRSLAPWLYVALNASAGVAALLLIRAFDWDFGQTQHVDLYRILVAGFGAIAFFRSSLFVAKIGGTNVGVGPSLVLGSLLEACDREVDRRSAVRLAEVIQSDRLERLDPNRVMSALPILCLALMQNFAPSDQAQLGAEIVAIRQNADLDDSAKMRAVIIQLAKYLGGTVVANMLTVAAEIFVAPPSDAAAMLVAEARKLRGDA